MIKISQDYKVRVEQKLFLRCFTSGNLAIRKLWSNFDFEV